MDCPESLCEKRDRIELLPLNIIVFASILVRLDLVFQLLLPYLNWFGSRILKHWISLTKIHLFRNFPPHQQQAFAYRAFIRLRSWQFLPFQFLSHRSLKGFQMNSRSRPLHKVMHHISAKPSCFIKSSLSSYFYLSLSWTFCFLRRSWFLAISLDLITWSMSWKVTRREIYH